MQASNHVIEIETSAAIEYHDVTTRLRDLIADAGIRQGQIVVSSLHTTCAVTVNENEPRLLDDIRRVLTGLIPADAEYLHNDIEARGMPDEPRNAHSHIIAMLLGASQTLAIAGGDLAVGTWQSVLLVELDGPRQRRVNVQITGWGQVL